MICPDCNNSQFQAVKCSDCQISLYADHDPDGMKFFTGCRNWALVILLIWLLVATVLLFPSCGGGSAPYVPPQYNANCPVTGIGDSTMTSNSRHSDGTISRIFYFENEISGFCNLAVNGSTIQFWIDHAPTIHLQKVIISLGINSVKDGSLSIETVLNQYETLLNMISADKIYVIGLYPVDQALLYTWYDGGQALTPERVMSVNNGLFALALKHGLTFIDTSEFYENGIAKREYTEDGIHPSLIAYQTILQKLKGTGL